MEKEERKRLMEEVCIVEDPSTHAQTELNDVAGLSQIFEKLRIHETHHTNPTDAILSTLGDTDNIDPRMGVDDEPRTWKEAQASPEVEEWTKGYLDELKSLKDMGIYKLVPRSSVPAGTKIRKGRPIFS